MNETISNKETLEYLGVKYEEKLINQIITDHKFGHSIIDIINPNYFHNDENKVIVSLIKKAKKDYDIIPDFDSLLIRTASLELKEIKKNYIIKLISKIKESVVFDALYIQKLALNFCKQQELKKSIVQIQKIIEKNEYERYDECEEILKKALSYGNNEDYGLDIFHKLSDVLSDDFRKPIRTGISKLDGIMNGGLSKGELGLILAPYGVGKTTLITKIANTAYNDGLNVLQIFFEDTSKVIQRKHLACWSGIELNELQNNKELVLAKADEMQQNGGRLILLKLPSDNTTILTIKKHIQKKISEGFRPDLILVDYIDVVKPSKEFNDVYAGEGDVMRQFETLLTEFDIAGWTATQGNRKSLNTEIVEGDQMGGSIKKGQVAHFIMSIGKSLPQKETSRATITIIKSRFGKDGMIFEDVEFDNARVSVSMDNVKFGVSRTTFDDNTKKENQQRVSEIFNNRKELLKIKTEEN
jgi:replicative DNA helicase